jgi:hypothetical protein
LPCPVSFELTVTLLFFAPTVVPVTLTTNVQEPLAAIVPPVSATVPLPALAEIVPAPHVPLRPLGVATTSPAGSVSVNETPVTPDDALGFVIVNVNVVVPLSNSVLAPNTLLIVTVLTTDTVAFDGTPAPALAEETVTLLFFAPSVVPVTLTANVHCAPPASVAPDRLTLPLPACRRNRAATATSRETVGRRHRQSRGQRIGERNPVSEVAPFGFVIVNVSDVEPLSGMVEAPNDFVIDGGASTVSVAVDVLPVASVDVTVTLLFFAPAVAPTTLTLNVHDAVGDLVVPLKLTVPDPATAVIVPLPQLPVRPFGVATTRPAGNVSVKPTLLRVVCVSGLATVNVSVLVPFVAIVVGLNDLVMVGGVTTTTSTAPMSHAGPTGREMPR